MPWTFKIDEVSAGHFVATASHDTGKAISKDGTEDIIPEIIEEAFRAEIKTGTFGSKAAYSVTLDFLGTANWEGRYHEGMFGSWSILNRRTKTKAIHYDGRDFYLMVSRQPQGYSWQGELKQLDKGRCHYFREVATL